jgi:hypothetical protein
MIIPNLISGNFVMMIDTLGSVEVLDLMDSKIEECHVVFDLECTLQLSLCRRAVMIFMMRKNDGTNTGTWQPSRLHFVSQIRYFLISGMI